MNVYTCDDHDGYWPVGVASVITAPDVETAQRLLDEQLAEKRLKTSAEKPYTLTELDTNEGAVRILCDGNY